MLIEFLMKGMAHGCYVVGLVLMLAVAALIIATATAMIVFACSRGEDEDDE